MGVLGDIKAGGKKALFLCTYTKDVSLFLTDETAGDEGWEEKLTKGNVRIVGMLKQIRQATENTVTVVTQRGESHEVDALYPALGCIVRSDLATGLGASSTENANLVVDDHQRTTVDGLYAAGDVVTDLHQLSVASAMPRSLRRTFTTDCRPTLVKSRVFAQGGAPWGNSVPACAAWLPRFVVHVLRNRY